MYKVGNLGMLRKDVKKNDTWDLSPMFKSDKIWDEELTHMTKHAKEAWPNVAKWQEKAFKPDVDALFNLLKEYFAYMQTIEKLYTYAHLKHDQDITDDKGKKLNDQATALYHAFSSSMAPLRPSLLNLDEDYIHSLVKNPKFEEYNTFLKELLAMKPYVLSHQEETILALSMRPLQTASKAFGSLNNADLIFEDAIDKSGKKRKVTHASYGLMLKGQDRKLRKNSFHSVHKAFKGHKNTLAELLQGVVLNHVYSAKARKYPSTLAAALTPNQIDPKVYTNLLQQAKKHLGVLHEYIAWKKKKLKLKELHFYDLYAPTSKLKPKKYSYEKACDAVIASTSILGQDYQEVLQQGLTKQRWVDRYENKGKRSGAYSSGCFGSHPYILMNFVGPHNDVMTLSHEAGHSMHSYLSRSNQPYPKSDYSIFVAEVASTFHEHLTFDFLFHSAKNKQEQKVLLEQRIEEFRATFFRQVLFADFELQIHQLAEAGHPLTPDTFHSLYLKLNQEYYGKHLTLDDELGYECFRIPHFYYNYYVYQYATGICAATYLFQNIGKPGQKEAYINFLSSGSSNYPLRVLKFAGADMLSKDPVESSMQYFQQLVDELIH